MNRLATREENRPGSATLEGARAGFAAGLPAEEEELRFSSAALALLEEEPLPAPAWGSSKTLVLIAGDEQTGDLLALLLTRGGYRVLRAEGNGRGLELAHVHPVDLVILDLTRPSMAGWGTLRRLRQLSLVPIMVLAARDEERDEVLAFSLGADGYLVKPFSDDLLKARVDALVRRSTYGGHRGVESWLHRRLQTPWVGPLRPEQRAGQA